MIRLAAVLALCATSATAQTCYDKAILQGYLSDRYDMTLTGWGLTASGTMHEMYQSPTGMWAVIETTPDRCSRLVSIPHQHYGRLAEPPRRNNAIPPAQLLDNGEPL